MEACPTETLSWTRLVQWKLPTVYTHPKVSMTVLNKVMALGSHFIPDHSKKLCLFPP